METRIIEHKMNKTIYLSIKNKISVKAIFQFSKSTLFGVIISKLIIQYARNK